jgi:hypothetical protein
MLDPVRKIAGFSHDVPWVRFGKRMIDEGKARPRRPHAPMATPVVMALAALIMCACSSFSKKEVYVEPNVFPTEYKIQILKALAVQLRDPTNLRDAYLAPPVMKANEQTPRYIACIRFNARGAEGGVETREMAAYFFAGSVTQVVNAPPGICANSAYEPFPELQKL